MQRFDSLFILFGSLCPEVSGIHSAAGWLGWGMDPPHTCVWPGGGGLQAQDHLECNEKEFAIAPQQGIQLFLERHCGLFNLSQSVRQWREHGVDLCSWIREAL